MLRREAERDGHVEILERIHLPVEPSERIGPEAVGPGDAGAQVTDAEPPQPVHRLIEPVVLEMEPLAYSEIGRVATELVRRRLWRAVLAQQPHVEVPVIGRALRLLVAGGGAPGLRQVVKAVPMDALDPAGEQL